MKKLSFKKLIIGLALMMCFTSLSSPIQVFAAADPEIQSIAEQYGPDGEEGNSAWPSGLAKYFKANDPGTGEYEAVKVGNKRYYYNPDDTDAIKDSAYSEDGDDAIQGTIDELNQTYTEDYQIKADVGGAAELMSGFNSTLNTFLGVLVTLITVGMTVFTALDLSYIAFPALRGKVDEKKEEGKFKHIVTEDARYAVVKADVENTGQNAFVIYGKKRILSFIVLSILVFILFTGNINVLTNIGVRLASGILKALNSGFSG